ncbi:MULTISPECIES: ATP-binding protein [Pseudomonas]|nr:MULTISPECIES: ATP-binding protein [Pseudomonas]KAA8701507.1 response regulator [Pseudomonas proteolytica]OHW40135.1 hybrid sensor histidine kinase/response regulator [Pseudomonas sp. 06C 126]TWR74941.1 response regulator [Pseudomonas proteolytica]SEE24381.1 PAS domain S-box-containing protein [Pseudomonas proteolytica]
MSRVRFFLAATLLASLPLAQGETLSASVGPHEFDLSFKVHTGADTGFYLLMALTSLVSIVCWHGACVFWRRRRLDGNRVLAAQVAAMRSMLDNTPQPVFIRDAQGRLVACNDSYLDFLSTDLDQLLGKKVTDGKHMAPDEAAQYHAFYLKVMRNRLPEIGGGILVAPFGQTVAIFHWIFPCFDTQGNAIGVMAGWIDVSDRQQLVDQLKASQKEAEDANKAKTTFLATMSHEIRTPMNAVLGMLEMASKRAEQGIVDQVSLDVASSAANGLVDLIGDILDIVRIESGQLNLAPGRVNLQELSRSVARIFDGVAQQKFLDLRVELDSRADCDVWVDSLRLKQILSNLLSNAIKFTVIGEVRFSLRCVVVGGGEELDLIFNVMDTGIGISQDDQARLFSPFSQVGNPADTMRTGSGLGLTITRTLCEMMHGQLSLTSSLGGGTDVSVALRLPILEPVAPAAVPLVEPVQPARRLRALVVDDYPANRVLLSQQLTYLGHDVSDSEDGAHGLRAWRKGAFDVVISDCHMPIMNGYDLASAIRAEEARLQLPRCLIIGLTANALPEEKQRCLDSGMDDCLFKPISLRDLSERLVSARPRTLAAELQVAQLGQGQTLDLSTLRQLARGDEQAISTLVRDLADSLDSDRVRLLEGYGTGDLKVLAELAHRVKGGGRIVGGQNVIIHCTRLEAACQIREPAQLETAVTALTQAMVTLSAELKRLG